LAVKYDISEEKKDGNKTNKVCHITDSEGAPKKDVEMISGCNVFKNGFQSPATGQIGCDPIEDKKKK
jgi:hypothetical protein